MPYVYLKSLDTQVPADQVFNTLTDRHRAARWLPEQVQLGREEGLVAYVAGEGGGVYDIETGEMAISWRRRGEPGWDGGLRVESNPAGGSAIRVRVRVPQEQSADAALPVVDSILRRFNADVADNLSAG